MARTFHRRQSMHAIAELNVIPLIDLAFSLLIIFMISTPLIQKNERAINVDLPASSEAPQRDPNQRFVSVTITSAGNYSVDGNAMGSEQLETLFKSYTLSRNPPVFSIRADKNTPWQEIVTVLDLLSRYNLTKFSIDTQKRR